MRTRARDERFWEPALGPMVVGSLALGIFTPEQIGILGLTPVLVAIAVAAVLGAAVAQADWLDPRDSRWAGLEDSFTSVAILGTSASLCTAELPSAPRFALLAAGIFIIAFLPRSWRLLAGLLAVLPAFGVFALSTSTLIQPGWDALVFDSSASGPGLGIIAGTLIGWAPGMWTQASSPAPGRHRLPWLVAGAGSLVALGATWFAASRYVSTLGVPDPQVGLPFIGALAAGLFLRARPEGSLSEHLTAAVLLLWCWMSGSLAFWWPLILPTLLGVAAAIKGVRRRSWTAGVLALLLLLGPALLLPSPSIPTAPAGLVLVVPWLLAIWLGATRVLRSPS